MGKDVSELASYMQPLCLEFLDKALEVGIPCLLVDTGRTEAEQEVKLAQGVSWTQKSKHLPQPPENKSEAFDVVPKVLIEEKGWAPDSPLWAKLGEIGEALGLHWGGRFPHPDPGHFQYIHT